MLTISVIQRQGTKKAQDRVNVRFRLRDGSSVDLYHKSGISATIADLSKFNSDGKPKPRTVHNVSLANELKDEIALIRSAYVKLKESGKMPQDSAELEEAITVCRMMGSAPTFVGELMKAADAMERALELLPSWNGDILSQSMCLNKIIRLSQTIAQGYTPNGHKLGLIPRFEKYISDCEASGSIGGRRILQYNSELETLRHYLAIKHLEDITPADVSPEMVLDIKDFTANEYKYVESYPAVYSNSVKPRAARNANTVTCRMRMLNAFLGDLKERKEIMDNPFDCMGQKNKRSMLKETYSEPYALTIDELRQIIGHEVEDSLQATKTAFILQCALGCRIGDYKRLTMDNVSVSEEGIPYVHYLPEKTKGHTSVEIRTPLVKYAFDIVKETRFDIPILRNVEGHNGYQAQIKKLLKDCGIDRKVMQSAESYAPLCDLASTKLARKTFVSVVNNAQPDKYAAGLHAVGSAAVERYQTSTMAQRHALLSVAFAEPRFVTDNEMNIIVENAN